MTSSVLHRLTHPEGRGLSIPRRAKVALLVLGILIALLIILRLLLDPIAAHETRKALDGLDGFNGDFAGVHVTVFPPGYQVTKLRLAETSQPDDAEPMVYAERVRATVSWRQALHGRLVAALRVDHPKLVITAGAGPKAAEPKAQRAPDLSPQLERALGMKVDRVEVFDGEVLFRQVQKGRDAELWVHRLELAAQNLATRRDLTGGRPATVSAHGRVGKSGDLNLFVSADPLASPLSFAGQVSVVGFRAEEVYGFVAPKTDVQPTDGTIDVFAEFVAKNGKLSGGVKPVVKRVDIGPVGDDVWDRLKAWSADEAVELLSDRVPRRDAVATTIPLKGRLVGPDVQLWPAVLGVIRNAFVQGLVSGFANLPPPTATQKQGALTQLGHALDKDAGPPKAQPEHE